MATLVYWYGAWRLFGWYLFTPRCMRAVAGEWWAGRKELAQ